MNIGFLTTALAVAVLDWTAVARKLTRLGYVTKPGVMLVLLAWIWLAAGAELWRSPLLWLALGLLASLAGDIFLMLPKEQFVAGLASFLIGHVCYIIAFNPIPPTTPQHLLVAGVLALLVLLPGVQIARRIVAGLRRSGKTRLIAPVMLYSLVISVMLLSALFSLLRDAWDPFPALAVCAGAALFYLSDSLLAWNKFVAALPNGRLLVRITYHLGQILLTLGTIKQYF